MVVLSLCPHMTERTRKLSLSFLFLFSTYGPWQPPVPPSAPKCLPVTALFLQPQGEDSRADLLRQQPACAYFKPHSRPPSSDTLACWIKPAPAHQDVVLQPAVSGTALLTSRFRQWIQPPYYGLGPIWPSWFPGISPSISFIKVLSLFLKALPSWPNHILKAPISKYHHNGNWVSTQDFWGDILSHSRDTS